MFFTTAITDLIYEMDSQPFELVPDGHVFFEEGLELFELFFFQDELWLVDDYFFDFVVFSESHQDLIDYPWGDQFKQSTKNMNIPLLSAYFMHVAFAIASQRDDNFHCIFCHVEKHIIWLRVPHNRNGKEWFFNLFELFLGTVDTEISDLLESVRLGWLSGMSAYQL